MLALQLVESCSLLLPPARTNTMLSCTASLFAWRAGWLAVLGLDPLTLYPRADVLLP